MKNLRILYLGDLVGKPGLRALFVGLSPLVKETGARVVAVNAENLAEGFGLTPEDKDKLFAMGVSVISSGNHIWQKDDIVPFLDSDKPLLRPENYPPGVPGHGSFILDVSGESVGFLNLQGRVRMGTQIDCPYRAARKAVSQLHEKTAMIIIDFHAEDVREKEAMFHYMDGRVSAVLGTHTHVQTTDARILPGGTAVITDLGMCGPGNSVIGTKPELSVNRSLTQLPIRMEVLDSAAVLQGVVLEIDTETGKAVSIERISSIPGDG